MSDRLFNQLCTNSTLYKSWLEVKRKGSAGGIDGNSIEDFEKELSVNLEELCSDLKNRQWFPEPYLRINIPKKNGEKRKLGLLTVRDKIVQQAIKTLIEQKFERIFVPNSYGYRTNKGHNKAIKFARHCCSQKGINTILRLDIDNYFDNIDHEILMKRTTAIIGDDEISRLISLCIKMGVVSNSMKWDDATMGVPQGAILSPILANFYLHPFDQFVLTRTKCYVRYADDFIICCKSEEEAQKLEKECADFLSQRLHLKLNTPEIISLNKGVEFLGIFLNTEGIGITEEKLEKLKQRIKELAWQENNFSAESKAGIKGIHAHYANIIPQKYLETLDNELIQHIKDIIRCDITKIRSKTALTNAIKDISFFSESRNMEKNIIRNDLLTHYANIKSEKNTEENKSLNKKIINKRKREYRKKENEGSELIVDTFGTFIGTGKKGITIKVFGKLKAICPTTNLRNITILSNGVTISSDLFNYCREKDISIDFFSMKGQHTGSLLSNSYFRTSLWEKQIFMPLDKKVNLARKIIYGKIRNQMNLIKYFDKYHGDTSPELSEKTEEIIPAIEKISEEVKNFTTTDKDYNKTLVALEASSAVLYWGYIRELLADDEINFIKRERHGATDIFNSMLNYGYSILYARIWQLVLKYRMNPATGIIHEVQGAKPVFVYDIIELFRSQCVDRVVISLVQKKEPLELKDGKLTSETRRLLIKNILERMNRYENYRTKDTRFSDIIKDQVRAISEYIDSGKTFRPYIAKW